MQKVMFNKKFEIVLTKFLHDFSKISKIGRLGEVGSYTIPLMEKY